MIQHILERSVIHFFSAGMVTLGFRYLLYVLDKHVLTRALGGYIYWLLPCFVAPFVIFLREPFDVAKGGPLVKSYTDILSWAVGCLVSTYLSRAMCERDLEAAREIQVKKKGVK